MLPRLPVSREGSAAESAGEACQEPLLQTGAPRGRPSRSGVASRKLPGASLVTMDFYCFFTPGSLVFNISMCRNVRIMW